METEGILGKQQQVSISSPNSEGCRVNTGALTLTLLKIKSKMREIEFNELIFTSPSSAKLGQFGIAEKPVFLFSLKCGSATWMI